MARSRKKIKCTFWVVGDQRCGKSSLIKAFVGGEDKEYKSESVDTCSTEKVISCSIPDEQYPLTTQDDYQDISINFEIYNSQSAIPARTLSDTPIIIVAYDSTNMESYKNVEHWIDLVKKTNFVNKETPIIALVGTKYDKGYSRIVHEETASDFAESNNLNFAFQTSTTTTFNVNKLFSSCINAWLKQRDLFQVTFAKLMTDQEVRQKTWACEQLDERNRIVTEWVHSRRGKLKGEEWRKLRVNSLGTLFNEVAELKTATDKIARLKEAAKWSLFATHRIGFFGDTNSVKQIKLRIAALQDQADAEKATAEAKSALPVQGNILRLT